MVKEKSQRSMLVRPIPEFENPPVVEVALSVQFNASVLEGPLLMLRWGQVRDRFPRFEQTHPIPLVTETFGGPQSPRIEIQFSNAPQTPRILMVSESNTKVLQVQHNMFGYNWRKLAPEHEYPRYSEIIHDFEFEFAEFQNFLSHEGLGTLSPIQWEVTYVNRIFPEGVWDTHSDIGKIIPSTAPRLTEGFLPSIEQLRYASQYMILDGDSTLLGRLHVSVEPGYFGEVPIYLMKLTARGEPREASLSGIIRMMDVGHEWIVRGFATLTSSAMHGVWGRTS